MVLSRNCDGCQKMKECKIRYRLVTKEVGSKVYCEDGTAHLVDE